MFIVTLLTIAKTWKSLKCLSMDEWAKKIWTIYTMEYYSSIKNDEIPLFAITCVDLWGDYAVKLVRHRKTATV